MGLGQTKHRTIALLSFGLGGIAIFAVLLTGLNLYRVDQVVQQTYETLYRLETMMGELRSAESIQRGYLITGDDKYLAPYAGARNAVIEEMERLAAGVGSRSQYRQTVDEVSQLATERLKELDGNLTLRRDQGFDPAREVVQEDRGGRIMGRIRELALGLESGERQILSERQGAARRLFFLALGFAGAALLLSIPLLVLVLFLVRREAHTQSSLARALQVSNEELNQRVAERTSELEAAVMAREVFFAKMSHEFRTPLNAVIGFADMIASETLGPVGTPQYREYAEDIRYSGQHVLVLVNDILDAAQAHLGSLTLNESIASGDEILHEVRRMLLPAAARRSIDLTLESSGDGRTIRCDERRMRQILLNLVSNAIKFTPDKGRVRLGYLLSDGRPCFMVSDTGIGMSPADLRVAMRPFGQAGRAQGKGDQGTGLGLPLTRELVELHGGELRIESAPGRGTTVSVLLPKQRALSAAA